MDYRTELKELLTQKPELRTEAQKVLFEGGTASDQSNFLTTSYEAIYKAVKTFEKTTNS